MLARGGINRVGGTGERRIDGAGDTGSGGVDAVAGGVADALDAGEMRGQALRRAAGDLVHLARTIGERRHVGGERGDALVRILTGFAQRGRQRANLRFDARQIGDEDTHIGEGGGGGRFELFGLAGQRLRLAAHRRADLGQAQRRILAECEQLLAMFGDGLAIVVDSRGQLRHAGFERGGLGAHRGGGAAEAIGLAPAGALE